MVPVDGSPESHNAIGVAEQIALAQGAEVVLVRVVEPLSWEYANEGTADPRVYEELLQSIDDDANRELETVEQAFAARGIKVRRLVPHGIASSELLDAEQGEQPQLVVMATHGRSGLARFALGSIADRLVREGTKPVLLVRRSMAADVKLETAVVMLDGSAVAEQVLPIVGELAGKPLKSATFFQSVPNPDDSDTARAYMEGVAARVAQPDFPVNVVVDGGYVDHTIRRVARERDLVILATHGRGGFDRLRHGSVAEAVVREVSNPVLLVRASSEPR